MERDGEPWRGRPTSFLQGPAVDKMSGVSSLTETPGPQT